MPEPHTSALLGGAAAAAPISVIVGGTLLGAQIDALLVGLLSALFVSAWLHEINSVLRSAAACLFASLVAGYGSPAAASVLVGMLPAGQDANNLRLLSAMGLAAIAPGVVPLLLARARGYAQSGQMGGRQ